MRSRGSARRFTSMLDRNNYASVPHRSSARAPRRGSGSSGRGGSALVGESRAGPVPADFVSRGARRRRGAEHGRGLEPAPLLDGGRVALGAALREDGAARDPRLSYERRLVLLGDDLGEGQTSESNAGQSARPTRKRRPRRAYGDHEEPVRLIRLLRRRDGPHQPRARDGALAAPTSTASSRRSSRTPSAHRRLGPQLLLRVRGHDPAAPQLVVRAAAGAVAREIGVRELCERCTRTLTNHAERRGRGAWPLRSS